MVDGLHLFGMCYSNVLSPSLKTALFQPFLRHPVKVKVAQSRPTLCGPTDYTVHGILQAGYRSG